MTVSKSDSHLGIYEILTPRHKDSASEGIRTFYKEVSADEDENFSVNLLEDNDIDEIIFDKSKTYAIRGWSIDPKIQAGVLLPNLEVKKSPRRHFKSVC